MTLLNIFRQADRVHLVTDGAALRDDDATICRFVSKVMVFPHLNVAVGFRGTYQVAVVIMNELAEAQSFDALRADLSRTISRSVRDLSDLWQDKAGPDALQFDVAVVGWSQHARGPVGCFVSTIERPGTPTFKVIEIDNFITPSTDELYREVSLLLADQGRFDPERHMVAIAEKQRAVIEPIGLRGIPSSWVGGFLQLTTVTEHEITTKIIHRWPDQIGRRIAA